ncbi:MAG: DUF559 domain-containing protein [Candidatus Magasanikbacteria bacterium]|nr:DUF559 domain-containing protein [Candidatus Magasanikbacteria bacterium]
MKILTECNLAQIVVDLLNGQTVVFPTETSYGLGCDSTNQEAVDKIFKIKGRRSDKPLLVVVPNVEMAKRYLVWNETLEKIASKYWPGALTVVGEYARPLLALPLLKGEAAIGSAPPPKEEGIEGRFRFIDRVAGLIRTIPFRRELRKNQTKAEKVLWSHLRAGRLGSLKFKRQHGIGNYIVDFFHPETKTIIEVDGDVHFVVQQQEQKDRQREKWLEEQGYKIVRYNNVDIFNNLEGVLQEINFFVTQVKPCQASETSPCPPLVERGGGGVAAPLYKKEGIQGEISLCSLATGVVAQNNTVAIRVTAHPLLKSITEKMGRPLVATSANLADAGDVYSADEIVKMYNGRVETPDIILNYNELPAHKPSTIVSVVSGELKILRQGEITILLE